ncbi:MFS transporter [Actinophytocola oryzae]|uniref:MFS transporter n=1 Tax=Actinophytocola oryzae TaxID=502181 RepID=A0A4R7V1T8_9PSEU|nr:MFS transporter [Actinophytocola oryzae]TDV43229.1 MFS transporter [Actinophytocola oryzae]
MGRRPGAVLVASGGGTLLALFVFTAPLSIVPAVTGGLGAGATATSWILSSMSLGLAVALLPSGALGDDFGRRRVFVAGAGVLAVGSLLCAVAPGSLVFVGGRVVEGLGAAAVLACGLAVLGPAFPDAAGRARATGVWGACLGAGIATGPLVGAALDDVAGWRTLYVVATVLSIAVAVVGRVLLDESVSGRLRRVDTVGSLLLAGGLAALLAALTEGRQSWTGPLELTLVVATVVLLGAFFTHQARVTGGMLDPTLFRRPALLSATVGAFVAGAGVTALMVYVSTLLEKGLALTPLAAASTVLFWSATSVVSALLTRRLPAGLSGGVRMSVSLLVVSAGLVPLAFLAPDSGVAALAVGLVVAGVGTGVLNASLGREAVASVPPHRAGMGSGINNTSRYVGAAVGVTVVTLVAVHPSATPAALVEGWNAAVHVGIAVSLVGAAVIAALTAAGRRSRVESPAVAREPAAPRSTNG